MNKIVALLASTAYVVPSDNVHGIQSDAENPTILVIGTNNDRTTYYLVLMSSGVADHLGIIGHNAIVGHTDKLMAAAAEIVNTLKTVPGTFAAGRLVDPDDFKDCIDIENNFDVASLQQILDAGLVTLINLDNDGGILVTATGPHTMIVHAFDQLDTSDVLSSFDIDDPTIVPAIAMMSVGAATTVGGPTALQAPSAI